MGWFSSPSGDKKQPPLQGRPKMEPKGKNHICTPWCAEHSKKKPKAK